jgi:succinate-semialdehyde dehydrogenase/glutarate-semialdehyde dehydrogenase
MRAGTEELFGPVAVIYKAKDADEAIELANDSVYGLGSSIFSTNIAQAQALATRLETGMTFINSPTGSEPALPFGGVKNSGFGRELSYLGMDEFINKKLIRTLSF